MNLIFVCKVRKKCERIKKNVKIYEKNYIVLGKSAKDTVRGQNHPLRGRPIAVCG